MTDRAAAADGPDLGGPPPPEPETLDASPVTRPTEPDANLARMIELGEGRDGGRIITFEIEGERD